MTDEKVMAKPLKNDSQYSAFKTIATFVHDLNNDAVADSIVLFSKDSVAFQKIKISLAGFESKTFTATNEWTKVDSAFLKANLNAITTDKVFLYQANGQSVLMLFGDISDGIGREDYAIITVRNNAIKLPFTTDENSPNIEIPLKIGDFNGDGTTDFLFTNYHEMYDQTEQGLIGTYAPFFIYSLADTFALNKNLTKRYNEEYYVFAGFQQNQNIKVLRPYDTLKKYEILR